MRFLTLKEFITHHNKLSIRLLDYVDAPRSNYVRISRGVRQDIDSRNDYWLSAASPDARILLARIIDAAWDEWVERLPAPFHFVTIVPRRYAYLEHEAGTFDLAAHQGEIVRALGRHSFIGMTEPAYYPNWSMEPGGRVGPIISWHSHFVTMGSQRADLEQDLADLAGEESLLPNASAVHIKPVSRERTKSKLLYSCKMPFRTYRPYPLKTPRERVNQQTGEVTVKTHGHRKYDMRTGEFARMVNLLACDHHLDELIFGHRLGGEIANVIRSKAREQLDRRERQELERRRQ